MPVKIGFHAPSKGPKVQRCYSDSCCSTWQYMAWIHRGDNVSTLCVSTTIPAFSGIARTAPLHIHVQVVVGGEL